MYKGSYEIKNNKQIAENIFEMQLYGDTSAIIAPGQFINISLDPFYLRRPISICDYDKNSIKIIYKVVSKGTEYMSKLSESKKLDILCGLGNGYNINRAGNNPVIIGGGVGVPPLYNLAKALIEKNIYPKIILGFGKKSESFYINEFKDLGCDVKTATIDGSIGTKGLVTDLLYSGNTYSYFFSCGPIVMLKAVSNAINTDGQVSLEERMGCGFGACMGCSIKTKNGFKRVCKDGPVFERSELLW